MTSCYHGLLVVDKPRGITSRLAVDRVQSWFPRGTRVGHTGTLDPLASGVLVVCVGAATRLAEYVQEQDKVYHTRVRLGFSSNTDDAEGTITASDVDRSPERTDIVGVLGEFTGWSDQVPPAFSAIQIAGRRAYDLARRGCTPHLSPRRVHVECIDLLSYAYPDLELEVRCGEGTYIRSLARDIGARLGCGAYVEMLRRLQVGTFDVRDALPLDADPALAHASLLPLAAAFAGPKVALDPEKVRKLRHGQRVPLDSKETLIRDAMRVAVLDDRKELAAICATEAGDGKTMLVPMKVIPPPGVS